MAQEINIYLSDDQMLEDVGNAFNSRTRRDILRLCANKSYSIYGLAEALNMAIPTISFHVKILQKAGLVIVLQHPNKKDNEKTLLRKEKRFIRLVFVFISFTVRLSSCRLQSFRFYLLQTSYRRR